MKQVVQNLGDGGTEVIDLPSPASAAGQLLIETSRSLISSGTERMLVEFGKANLVDKIRQQPDKVKQVIEKARTDGVLATLDAVRAKLDEPIPLGYCNVGTVLEVPAGTTQYRTGERVVSNGAHAGVVRVPVNLTAKVPDTVSDEAATFTVLGAIALQGVRLVGPTIGETVVVSGLGLIGLLAVQILRANGCRVIALDFDAGRLEIARGYGAVTVDLGSGDDPVELARGLSNGIGVDAVLIAAATDSSDPVRQAARMCRKRGRIVLVGVTGLEISRADFYEKEITFQVSCSYGPGRYDPQYEERGQDYPIGFVRWTEGRNFQAILELMAEGKIDVGSLVTHRYPVEKAPEAYRVLTSDRSALGIVLEYDPRAAPPASSTMPLAPSGRVFSRSKAVIALIGAGNYALRVLAPALKRSGARLHTVVTTGSVRGWHAARRFGFENVSTDLDAVLADPQVTAIVIATRHDNHATLTCRALRAGKHVFVEKPLALSDADVDAVASAYRSAGTGLILTVGFNRRFAPLSIRARELLRQTSGPIAMTCLVNAGAVPLNHWTQDQLMGGGRIIGEACHFVDLLRYFDGTPIASWSSRALPSVAGAPADTAVISLGFESGSIGVVQYFANGGKAFPKERMEIFSSGRILQLDNFRSLRGFNWPGFARMSKFRQDKGQDQLASAFVSAVLGEASTPISIEEVLEVSRVSIDVAGI